MPRQTPSRPSRSRPSPPPSPPPGRPRPTLSDDDYRRLLALRTGLRRFLRWSESQAAGADLLPAQHQLLLAVRGHPDRRGPTVGELAAHLLLRPHSVVGLVDRADARGLVIREHQAEDHRLVRVRLTPEGEAKLASLSAVHMEELARLVPELAALWQGLEGPAGGPSPVGDGTSAGSATTRDGSATTGECR